MDDFYPFYKKYYCFTSGCGYDGNNCISKPDCVKVNTGDESTSSAVKNYAEVAGEMLGTMVAFSAGITAAKAGLKKMDELVLKRILSVRAEKLMLETVESVMDHGILISFRSRTSLSLSSICI